MNRHPGPSKTYRASQAPLLASTLPPLPSGPRRSVRAAPHRAGRLALVLAWALGTGTLLPADEPSVGITVVGSGEVLARPDLLEIHVSTSGSAELSGDALVKYREAKQRTIDAFQALGLANLRVEQRGLAVQSQGATDAQVAAMMGAGGQAAKVEVDIQGDLRLSVSGIDQLPEDEITDTIGKLVDTARDSGASLAAGGSSNQMLARIYGQQVSAPIASFVVTKVDALRQQAYLAAFRQSQARATQLAELSGAALGPVLSIQEAEEPPQPNEASRQQRLMAAIYGWGETGAETKDRRLTSDRLGEVPVRVMLRVRFALLPRSS